MKFLILLFSIFLFGFNNLGYCAIASGGDGEAQNATGWTKNGTNIYQTTITDNVGIGSASPVQTLDVNGTVRILGNLGIGTINPQAGLQIVGSGNAGTIYAQTKVATDSLVAYTGGTTPLSIGGAGNIVNFTSNVGIGTVNPQALLNVDVNSGSIITGIQCTNAATNATANRGCAQDFTGTANGSLAEIRGFTEGAANNTGALEFRTSSAGSFATAMRIASTGNVGIGSTNPGQLLDVNGTIRIINATAGGIILPYPSAANIPSISFTASTGARNGIIMNNNNNWGNFGGAVINGFDFVSNSTQVNGATTFLVGYGSAANASTGFASFNENVGIGSLNPGQMLDVTGTIRVSTTLIASGMATDAGQADATVCAKTTDGTFFKGSGTLGICLGTSTKTAKQNITPITDGLPQIMRLNPVSFNYKPGWGYDPEKPYYGFLAEDVVKVLPRLVGKDAEGNIKNADYVGMIPVMVKSIQEMQREIEELKKMVK